MIGQDLIRAIHENAVTKGFWRSIERVNRGFEDGTLDFGQYKSDSFEFYAKQCMMIVSEVSELMEALRKEKGVDEVESEAADVFIRLADLYVGLQKAGLAVKPLDTAVVSKMGLNITRPERHGVLG